jgi:uncharacterized protein YbaP (TraB family)
MASADPAAWRVAGSDGGSVTLLGSMHALRAADYPLPSSIDVLFDDADILVMELDLDDVDAARDRDTLLRTATLPPGRTLRNVVTGEVYALAERRTRALGLELAAFQSFEPWFVAVTLLDQGLRNEGFDPDRGLEQYLVGKARAARKEIVGLETFELQIGLFAALPPTSQQAMLLQTLQELDGAGAATNTLAAAWRDGQLDTMSRELLADFDDFPGLYSALVTERNRAWVNTLEQYLRDGRRYLVVVGALHLVGHDSVIDMLAARGHTALRLH